MKTPFGLSVRQSILLGAIILLGIIAYSPLLKADFIIIDDPQYVTENMLVQDFSLNKVAEIFTSNTYGHYQPLSVLSYIFDHAIWGNNATGYHLTNILLHLINIILVFLLTRKLSQNNNVGFISALLFSIHPMHVESVAWISERKDVLYAVFYLAACLSYLKHLERNKDKKAFPFVSLILFVLSLMSKSMAMTLPIMLLLFDYFKFGRITKKDFLIKLPFFALSVLFGIIAINTQQSAGFITDIEQEYNLIDRLFLLSYSVVFYLFRFFVPYKSGFYYQYPDKESGILPPEFYVTGIILIIITIGIFFLRSQKKKLIFGLLFFIISISVVLRIIPLEGFLWEHNVYVGYVGLYLAISWIVVDWLFNKPKTQKVLLVSLLLIGTLLTAKSFIRAGEWESTFSLAEAEIKNMPPSISPYIMRGRAYLAAENPEKAIQDANKALDINPDSRLGLLLRASVKQRLHNYQGIIEDYTKALKTVPEDPLTLNNRGLAYIETGAYEKALEDFSNAIKFDPQYAQAFHNRAGAYLFSGDIDAACSDYNQAFRMGYRNSKTMIDRFCNLSNDSARAETFIILSQEQINSNRPEKAINLLEHALLLKPENPQVYYWMGSAYQQMKNFTASETAYSKCIAHDPNNAIAYSKRAAIRGAFLSNPQGALSDLNIALDINPDIEEALYNRAVANAQNKNFEPAIADLTKILDKNPSQNKALFMRGLTYMQMGQKEKACADWNSALALGNNDAANYINRFCKP